MKIYKDGQHRLFENDTETAGVVSSMLLELERDGMDAVRKYSRQFDGWHPPAFRLSRQQIEEAIRQLPEGEWGKLGADSRYDVLIACPGYVYFRCLPISGLAARHQPDDLASAAVALRPNLGGSA